VCPEREQPTSPAKVIWVVVALALLVLGVGALLVKPSPKALAPDAPRSRCEDVRSALSAASSTPQEPEPLVVRSSRLGFECLASGGQTQMRGRFHCDGQVFEATSLPECLPDAIDRVETQSDVVVWPFRNGWVAVTSLCRGCTFHQKGYMTASDTKWAHAAGPLLIMAGVALLAARLVQWWRSL
jgi:hypothetical protein